MKNGFTIIELMVVVAIIASVSLTAAPALQQFIQSQRVIHSTNNVISLIYQGKSEAIVNGRVSLCDANYSCERFDQTQQLILVRHHPDGTDEIIHQTTLPPDITLRWSRFRGTALTFHRGGIAYYQNGHFMICNGYAARKIIMNWAGRPRVEKSTPDADCK
jgi:type IV fimbrial biogenesis protein FimT